MSYHIHGIFMLFFNNDILMTMENPWSFLYKNFKKGENKMNNYFIGIITQIKFNKKGGRDYDTIIRLQYCNDNQ